MPFSQEDTDRIRAALRAALESPSLTDWQRNFLGSMQTRFDSYGTRTKLTDKQYAKLKQILAPFQGATSTASQQTSSRQPRMASVNRESPSHSRSRSRPPKQMRTVRKARRTARDSVLIIVMIVGGLIALGGMFTANEPTSPERLGSSSRPSAPLVYGAGDFSITDGDTVQLHRTRKGTRLVGFNTPETFEPRCDRELALGRQASTRLKALVGSANRVELRLVACACPPGTQGTDDCNFGRSCGVLMVDDHDVGELLIAEGLAARFQCGRTSCPPLPRPWCG